jgi:hypothetical protein
MWTDITDIYFVLFNIRKKMEAKLTCFYVLFKVFSSSVREPEPALPTVPPHGLVTFATYIQSVPLQCLIAKSTNSPLPGKIVKMF